MSVEREETSRTVSPALQVFLGFMTCAVVAGATFIATFVAPESGAAVALVGTFAVVILTQFLGMKPHWRYFRYGVGIGFGVLGAAAVLWIGLAIATFPF